MTARSPASLDGLIHAIAPLAVDLGARGAFDRDLASIAWASDLVAFEPEPDEAARLSRLDAGGWRSLAVLPLAVGGSSGQAQLHLPRAPHSASLLPHDERMVERFGHAAMHRTERVVPVTTTTLDALASDGRLARLDHLKIDIEGAELDVLRSAGNALSRCVSVKVECSFVEQRLGQPLAWAVAQDLVARGFEIVELDDVHRWRRRPLPAHPYRSSFRVPYSRGKVAQCDLIALRAPDRMADQRMTACAIVIAAALGYFDHAIEVLRANPAHVEAIERQHAVRLEDSLAGWSKVEARRVAWRELGRALRGIVPLARSAFGVLPHQEPEVPY